MPEAKEALSSDTEVSIPVLTPAGQGSVRLHRSEFEAMIRPRIEETVDALRRAVSSAGLSPDQLSAVLLVGGSSRIPLVAELVSEQLGRPVAVDADPKNAIAKGAALSLHPVGLTATGVGQVPLQREARHAAETGAIPWYAAPQTVNLSVAHPARPPAGAPFVAAGPPIQRAAGMGVPPAGPPRPAYPDRPQAVNRPAGLPGPQPQSGRSPTMLVSIGGLSAAAAVIATLFLLPSTPSNAVPTPVADVPSTSYTPPTTTTTIAPTTTVAPPPEPEPVAPPPRRTTRRVVPPPPPPTTETTTTATETTTTTTETTTTTTTTPSEEPPPEEPPVDPPPVDPAAPAP